MLLFAPGRLGGFLRYLPVAVLVGFLVLHIVAAALIPVVGLVVLLGVVVDVGGVDIYKAHLIHWLSVLIQVIVCCTVIRFLADRRVDVQDIFRLIFQR